MKTLLLLVALLVGSVKMYAAAAAGNVVVSTSTVSSSTGIYFESATLTMPSMIAGTTPVDYIIDLYDAGDNKKALEFRFVTTPALSDGFGNTIPLTYTFVSIANGSTTSVLDNTWVEIINTGNPSYRDGLTSPGYLTIATAALPTTQASGSYTTGPIAVDIALDGYTSTVMGYLTLNAVVEEFVVIGFTDTSAETTGVRFIGNDIDFGSMEPGVTPAPITRDVYVHTNRDSDIQITFSNTPALLSSVDGTSTIPVNYSYTLNSVSANVVAGSPIVAHSGASDGTTSVGSITFAPDALTDMQAIGAYSATVNVVVSAM